MLISKKYRGKESHDVERRSLKFDSLSKVWRWAILFSVWIALVSALGSVSSAQSSRGFLLFGDVSVAGDSSTASANKPLLTELILYTKNMQLIARERVSSGRYRFVGVAAGDYWLVLELDGTEKFRDSVFIANTSVSLDVRHDLSVILRPSGVSADVAGVVDAADLYERPSANKQLYKRAKQAMDTKNYKDAINTLNQMVAADKADYPAWSELGMLYFVQKDNDNAEKSFTGSLAAKPDYFPALLSLGRVLMAKNNSERAVETLDLAVKADPKSAQANYFLGLAYLQIKKGSKAVGYLNEAIAIDPVGMADAHLNLASLYNGAGLKDKAAAEYEAFLKAKPDYPERKKLEEYIAANKKT
ncbi:hypothetical protein BH10ACI2_BH10ACI2_14070 [soil metagenome]